MTFFPTGFTNLALQQLSVSSLELAPTQVCERFPHTEHILKVIDGQVLLYLYCCKDLSYSRFWCSSSVTLSASSHLVSASVPGKLTPYSFKGPIFLLLKKITRLFLPPPAATIPSLPLPLLVPDLSQQEVCHFDVLVLGSRLLVSWFSTWPTLGSSPWFLVLGFGSWFVTLGSPLGTQFGTLLRSLFGSPTEAPLSCFSSWLDVPLGSSLGSPTQFWFTTWLTLGPSP